MKKAMLTLLASMLWLIALNAQSPVTISGKVVDAQTKEEIIFCDVMVKNTSFGTLTDLDGQFTLEVPDTSAILLISYVGYITQEIKVGEKRFFEVKLKISEFQLEEVVVVAYKSPLVKTDQTTSTATVTSSKLRNLYKKTVDAISATTSGSHSNEVKVKGSRNDHIHYRVDGLRINGFPNETYELDPENSFVSVQKESLSTFAVDVDRASYSNIRRYIETGQFPPKDAVRIEEMINYFSYNYKEPSGNDPFRVSHELSSCPWNEKHQVLKVALSTKKLDKEDLAPSNLVFLIDVSGSMSSYNKLPLVISSMRLLLDQMNPDDKVTIVTYAGAAGCALPTSPVSEKGRILKVLDNLHGGGSTAGGEGIELAYKMAKEAFIEGGNNRVILCTDGDFNVGISNPDGLEKLISRKRKDNIFLSVLGFGMGNYRGDMAQRLANKGNGNHAYIDNIHEARKILVREFSSSIYTVAKDVKIQIEFNPLFAESYRLIGYENRMLQKEDFNNDKKDGGEVGIGHSITALYEIIPPGVDSHFSSKVDDLVFQDKPQDSVRILDNEHLALVKIRYKDIESDRSTKMQQLIKTDMVKVEKAGDNTRFAISVALFGMILRDSEFLLKKDYDTVIDLASSSIKKDPEGEKSAFLNLVKSAKAMDSSIAAK